MLIPILLCEQAGDSWLLNCPLSCLPLMLVDAGYDVWIGNSRTTNYSSGHVTFNRTDKVRSNFIPTLIFTNFYVVVQIHCRDFSVNFHEFLSYWQIPQTFNQPFAVHWREIVDQLRLLQDFWNWSLDELAAHDLPAMLGVVSSETTMPIHYVGYSQVSIHNSTRSVQTYRLQQDCFKSDYLFSLSLTSI